MSSTCFTAFGRPENGSVPHCAVIPLPLSHTTALSSTPSTAGRSSAPPFLMEIVIGPNYPYNHSK